MHQSAFTSCRRGGWLVHLLAVALLTAVPTLSFAGSDAGAIRVGRYTTVAATPDSAEADPLATVIRIHIPRERVVTVGDAVNYVLLRTGYHLAPSEAINEEARAILALPLPEIHRSLGPYTVSTALSVLLGRPFELVQDPARREISYRLAGAADTPAAPGKQTVGTAAAPDAEKAPDAAQPQLMVSQNAKQE